MKTKSNLVIPSNNRCAFCDYLSRDRPYTILYQDEVVATLVTREQRGVGHVLVIPIRHVDSILDLNDIESREIMKAIRKIATAIDLSFCRPGIAVWQNNGIPAGQTIAHVHFHVAGTLENGSTAWGMVPEISINDTDVIANRLLKFLI